jgi:hypothetical protein
MRRFINDNRAIHVSLGLFSAILFIMIVTYTATAIIYGESEYIEEAGGMNWNTRDPNLETYDERFQEHWDNGWKGAYFNIRAYGDPAWRFHNPQVSFVYADAGAMVLKYAVLPIGESENNIFNHRFTEDDFAYINPYEAWNDHMTLEEKTNVLFTYNVKAENKVDISWNIEDIQDEDVDNYGFFEMILYVFGKIPEGIVALFKTLTFTGLPNMPMPITLILNIFFIPLWSVLIIGILPILISFLKALGELLNAITPLT